MASHRLRAVYARGHCNPAVRPEPWLPSELWILNQLARRLGLNDFPQQNETWWLEQALLPLRVKGKLSMADIKAGPLSLPGADSIPWQNNQFTTASGKYELYSLDALRAGHNPLPIYEDINSRSSEAYPYQLLTPHSKNSINSQHFYQIEEGTLPVAYIHPDLGRAENVVDGEVAIVATETGILRCRAEFDQAMLPGVVKIYQGWWLQANGGVNLLTQERVTDLGGNAAYYDCFCMIQSEHCSKVKTVRRGAALVLAGLSVWKKIWQAINRRVQLYVGCLTDPDYIKIWACLLFSSLLILGLLSY